MLAWHRWLQRPESLWVRKAFFQVHLWTGIAVSLYIALMSITGSFLVFRPQLERHYPALFPPVEWIVSLHENLLSGQTGRFVNGFGAIAAISLCLTGAMIWWPGIGHLRRSVTVDWKGHPLRVNWDLHSALGFWCFLFVLMWGLSGFYFCFPRTVNALFRYLDPENGGASAVLYWLSAVHFGRFNWFTEALWALLGLVPGILAVTGIYLSCHRLRGMIYKVSRAEG